MNELTLLTRDGCSKAPAMIANLNKALRALGWSKGYRVINIATLAADDPRSGYPTPTVLYRNHDLFGMAVPKARSAAPT